MIKFIKRHRFNFYAALIGASAPAIGGNFWAAFILAMLACGLLGWVAGDVMEDEQ